MPSLLVAVMSGSLAYVLLQAIADAGDTPTKMFIGVLISLCATLAGILHREATRRIASVEKAQMQTATAVEELNKKVDKQMRAFSSLMIAMQPERAAEIAKISEAFYEG